MDWPDRRLAPPFHDTTLRDTTARDTTTLRDTTARDTTTLRDTTARRFTTPPRAGRARTGASPIFSMTYDAPEHV